ncbi:hypothetical protein FA13DRAFT_1707318 [Coprinellus micaceus]|uniref:Uncharacterized protein n=1 Tax=Coprinellus micaceus TaxID=71717 RepID=A0A4Y7TMM6_COPMI|nr:hypothetical protein FA13DRAFT_1707318 [Coprinellus micaceus]
MFDSSARSTQEAQCVWNDDGYGSQQAPVPANESARQADAGSDGINLPSKYPRFARLSTDPRFRKPKKQQNRVVVDERFKSVLKQEKKKDKSSKGLVDKYGRSVSSTKGEDNLKRFYRLEGDEEEGKEGEDDAPARPDYAREESEDDDKKEDESDTGGIVRLGYDSDEVDDEADDDFAEIDLDEDNFGALEAQAAAYSKEHSEEDEEEAGRGSSDAADCCGESGLGPCPGISPVQDLLIFVTKKEHANMKEAPQVNIVRGKVLSVVVYPSDFGKERMAREEREGPPAEIFKKKKKESEEVTAKSLYELGGEDEVDDNALRKYQLERLRYYYAIVTCDNVEASSHVYDELQGTELERSANVFDMSFVPDGMEFENEPRDQATEDDSGAGTSKGIDFVTPALRHSKVALTWDEDDPERGHVTRRTLTKQEIEDGDFRAFIASSSESESEAESSKPKGKKNKKSAEGSTKGSVAWEITFTPGLIGKKDEGGDETTLEKYQRKMREKRKKRKEEVKEKGGEKGKGKEKEKDEFFGASSDEEEEEEDRRPASQRRATARGRSRLKSSEELELLAASNNPDGETKHFDFKAVLKAEKKGKKGRKGKKTKLNEDELQEDFSIDVQDERFKVLHEDHHFAIDPSNPHFKKTKGMTALLDERRKRLSQQSKEAPESKARSREGGPGNPSLQKLVESVKRKKR